MTFSTLETCETEYPAKRARSCKPTPLWSRTSRATAPNRWAFLGAFSLRATRSPPTGARPAYYDDNSGSPKASPPVDHDRKTIRRQAPSRSGSQTPSVACQPGNRVAVRRGSPVSSACCSTPFGGCCSSGASGNPKALGPSWTGWAARVDEASLQSARHSVHESRGRRLWRHHQRKAKAVLLSLPGEKPARVAAAAQQRPSCSASRKSAGRTATPRRRTV